VAVDALATVAAHFAAAAPDLRRLADSADGLPDCHAPDAFFQTLAAAGARCGCMHVVDLLSSRPAICHAPLCACPGGLLAQAPRTLRRQHSRVPATVACGCQFLETSAAKPVEITLAIPRTDDVREHIWRTGARANLPTGWLPGAVGGGAFAVLEPPAAASPWVAQLLQQARAFRQKLDAADRLQEADRRQVRRAPLCT
jgi:hypothetical protein